jgi:hypothetical protein
LEGYLALYKGFSGALLKEGPASAVYLGVYEAVKTALLADPNFAHYPILVYLISGALGETLGSVVRAPAEALKVRMQTGDSSLGESIQDVLIDEKGRSNVLNAWGASLFRDVPFGAIQLTIFEGLKEYISNSPSALLDVDVNTLAAEVVLGAIGGGIGAILSTPPDVVTTRILTQESDEACENPAGFGEMTGKILKEEGFGALCSGWQERGAYWAPAIGIFLSCYCAVRQTAATQHIFDHVDKIPTVIDTVR